MNIKTNHNKITTIKKASTELVIKHYTDVVRYACELKNIPVFSEHGFLVPQIAETDIKSLTTAFYKINGNNKEILNNFELTKCISILSRICQVFGGHNDPLVAEAYLNHVSKNIHTFALKNRLMLRTDNLDFCLNLLSKNFITTLFKDAKPSNWIFNKSKTYMIDFDYVVPSFYLADFAQMLSYQFNLSLEEKYNYLSTYVESLGHLVSECTYLELKKMFLLATINSNISSEKHNTNLNESITLHFKTDNIYILENLELM